MGFITLMYPFRLKGFLVFFGAFFLEVQLRRASSGTCLARQLANLRKDFLSFVLSHNKQCLFGIIFLISGFVSFGHVWPTLLICINNQTTTYQYMTQGRRIWVGRVGNYPPKSDNRVSILPYRFICSLFFYHSKQSYWLTNARNLKIHSFGPN